MKKIICFIVIVLSCFLSGCSDSGQIQETKSGNISIYVDDETGVNYIIFHAGYKGGITTRLNADGTPYISNLKNESN